MLDAAAHTTTAIDITLRPYQLTCVSRVLTAFQLRPKGGRVLIVLPTGCGKTLVFAKVAHSMGLTTLIIAHRQELLQQAADKYRMIDPTAIIGQVGAGRHEWGAPVTVASVQTISRPEHLKKLKLFGYGLVIIDECHHSASAGYQAVLDALPEACVLGVTATPDRLDKQSIEQIFGEPIFQASIIDMVEQGYLSNIRAIAIPTATSLDDLHTQAGDFKLDELEIAVDTPDRNGRIVKGYLKHCNGRQGLCFAVTVAHAEHLADAFKRAGIPAASVCGETPQEERKRILADYDTGELLILCNVGVLTEGYDHPKTSCILMGRPTQSRALYVQSIGRGTRLAPGKIDCIILDITDNTLKHRLEPLSLSRALVRPLRDGESILEAKEREEREEQEQASEKITGQGEERERWTKVTKREQDLEIHLLDRMKWQRKHNGVYHMDVGEQKHRILLFPSETTEGHYSVWAKLAPDFRTQQWLKDSPLDDAMQHAEMKARLLQSEKKQLVDMGMPWRSGPVTDGQRFMLIKFGIDYTGSMTSGEASDLIGKAIVERDRLKALKKAEQEALKKAKKNAKELRKRGRASA
ncbi:MAG: DEAD/DEAH box helicase [Ktedonobacteraceae bacterium]|nr:DEAD/DEAH box helicase [Ktedonobacteraceae bacterium]